MDCIGHGPGREDGHESGDKIWDKIGDEIAAARVFEHPREVTGIVKAALGLGPAQWRYFTPLWEELERSPKRGVEYREPLLKNIRLWTRFLADVNRPEAGRGAFLKAAKLDHEYYSRARWRHGDPWRAWVHLGNQFLATDPGANAVRWMEFHDISDALRWHIEHEQPWGPAGWTVYIGRSARWHQEMNAARDQEARARYEDARWESLVGEVDLGDPAHGGVHHTEGQVFQYTIDLNRKKRRRQPGRDEKKAPAKATAKKQSGKLAPSRTPEEIAATEENRQATLGEYNRKRNKTPERIEYNRHLAQEQRRKAKESGKCRNCPAPAITGQTRCPTCAEAHRQSRRRSDAKRRAAAKETRPT